MIEEADSRGFLKAAKCEEILPSLFFRWWVMKQNTEKEIFLESYQQKQSNAVAMHSEGQCLHSSCTTWDVLKLNELPRVQQILQSPHLGNMQHKKEELLQVLVWYFTVNLHASCEGHYLGQDWFEANSGHLLGKRGSLPESHRQVTDITFHFLRF